MGRVLVMGKGPLPKVVKERRKRRLSVRPPDHGPHPWARVPVGEDRAGTRFFLSGRCMDDLIGHCTRQARKGVEALGFLVGGVFSWKRRAFTVARDAVTTDLDASAVSVRFERDGFPGLFERLDGLGYDYLLVGWYHSHPGYGCFMSETDIRTQTGGFSEPFHMALVVDPVRKEAGAFRSLRPKGGRRSTVVEEVGFGMFDEDVWEWPGPVRGGR
jgi:26S proteasome regulatory subunit N11